MKKTILPLAAIAAALAVAFPLPSAAAAEKPVPVMLTLELNKSTSHTSKSGGSGIHRLRRYSSGSKTVTRTNTYSARLTCTPPKGVSKRIELEVYNIVSKYGKNGTQYKIAGKKSLGTFTFAQGLPTSHKVTFDGPTSKTTNRVRSRRNGGRRYGGRRYGGGRQTHSERSGTGSGGVIVRAIMDGRVVQSRVFPSNYKWEKVAKRDGDIGNGDIN